MKVLIGCEFSGVVRDAFLRRGHDAISCDFEPTDAPGPHYQGDVRELIYSQNWDLAIFHPPCTHLAVSGSRWFKNKQKEQAEALEFVRELMNAPIEKICIENPVGIISSRIRKPDQIIQPWQFGHPESKKTCLWLKNLPELQPTEQAEFKNYRCACGYVFEEKYGKYGCPFCNGTPPARPLWENQTPSGQNKLGPNIKDRAKLRSITYKGIGEAMAAQWG